MPQMFPPPDFPSPQETITVIDNSLSLILFLISNYLSISKNQGDEMILNVAMHKHGGEQYKMRACSSGPQNSIASARPRFAIRKDAPEHQTRSSSFFRIHDKQKQSVRNSNTPRPTHEAIERRTPAQNATSALARAPPPGAAPPAAGCAGHPSPRGGWKTDYRKGVFGL